MQGDTNQTELRRTMKGRHLFMIALGGVIGTGLFLGSGFTISEAGPIGAILAYVIGGFLMYLVMLCLGGARGRHAGRRIISSVCRKVSRAVDGFYDRMDVRIQLGQYSGA